jgi:hypothetical protein
MFAKIVTHAGAKQPSTGRKPSFYREHRVALHRVSVWTSLVGLLFALAMLGLSDAVPHGGEVVVRWLTFGAAVVVALILGVEIAHTKPGE